MGSDLPQETIPPNDVTHECQRPPRFEGKKLRYIHNQPEWSAQFNEFVTKRRDTLWTGTIGKTLTAQGRWSPTTLRRA